MSKNTDTYTFRLIMAGADPLTPENLDALYRAGCADATFAKQGSLTYAEFDRVAPAFADAVESAIRDVESAVPGLRVLRVEPDDLVSAADIARRTGRSRESIRLLAKGERGPGQFPLPDIRPGSRHPLWRWSDVMAWWATYLG
jgi:hypothetical protein